MRKQTKSGVWVPKCLFAETAAPPHWISIVLGVLSPTIGIAAVLISLLSFQTAREALNNSQQTLKVGQRAYLSVVEVNYADAHLQIHLKNSGNTPADIRPVALRVVALGQTQFLELMDRTLHGVTTFNSTSLIHLQFNEVMRLSKRLALLSMRKDLGGKEDGWLDVACDKHHLTDWNGLPDKIVVAALLQYRDVFGEPHVITWGWFMDKLQVTRELNHFSVELLLAPRYPGDVDIAPAEQLDDEFNPQPSSPQR